MGSEKQGSALDPLSLKGLLATQIEMLHTQLKTGELKRKVKTREVNVGISSTEMECKVIQSDEITSGERIDCKSRLNTEPSQAPVRLEENQDSMVQEAK